ncbi:MAG: hypothetical protein M1831_002754 [Alyxoria varia]|nr:MAG: hypothetical protein M1831_002754 [Alyxoria varia]
MGCSSLHADFGNLFDKRKPQFIHGLDATGSVTSSDRKGKFDSWGFIDRVAFRHFSEVYPGYSQWGLGPTDIIGLPNVMDVSQPYGMVYGEGTPGGFVFHLASDERHGRYLAPFLNVGYPELGVPKIHQDLQCVCSVWMAKSSSIPRVSKGAVGILAGSSSGVVSAFSFGSPTTRDNRFDRGQLTARWLLSPGVPIVSIVADDNITDERRDQGRVWAVALNALGEIFYLKCFPSEASESIQLGSKEVVEEVTAWQYGQSVDWNLIWPTLRSNRYPTRDRHDSTGPLPSAVTGDSEPRNITDETRMMEAWLHKSPVEIKADFKAWDMRRSLKVDFGGDDGHHSGEGIVIIEPGLEEGGSAKVRRFVRRLNKTSKDEFGLSRLVFGPYKGIQATASAVDLSNFANTTATEDKWHRSQNGDPSSFDSSVLNLPGQRGRLLGVGTTAGTVFLWNMRTPCPESSSLVSQIRPVRVIHTDSPGIASLAISSLYVVHGGEEGLVQAWDPLASTLLPLRTLSSRHAINNRRRAVIAAQQNPNQQRNPAFVQSLAASAICLDPNPTNLRGVVAIGGFLKYWSYSSVSAAEEGSKSQKRRLNKATRTSGGSSGGDFSGTRRIGLKSYVEQEILQREIDERERRQESKEERRMAGRFGLDLLGHDASEEEMVAYAKLLSEEQKQKETRNGSEDLGQSTVAGPSLSDEGLKQWQYASWPQRLEMAGASSSAAHSRGSQTPTPKSVNVRDGDDAEVARAMELSIQEEARRSTSSRSESTADTSTYDEELAEAVARSLAPDATGADARASSSANTISAAARIGGGEQEDADDEVARAIKLSLQDTSSSPQVSSSTSERIPDGTDFPSLSSSSPEGTSRGKGKGKGKGKRRA